MHLKDNLFAGFPHLYYYSNPKLPERFLRACLDFRKRRIEAYLTGPAEAGDGSNTEKVYVTKYGEVYHTDPGCIYLNPQVRPVPASEVGGLRSGDGSVYYPCECCRPGTSGVVYITKEGNRYHADRNCGGIVRHISMEESETAKGHYRPCPACGAGHADSH
jgi:hypothetical protein